MWTIKIKAYQILDSKQGNLNNLLDKKVRNTLCCYLMHLYDYCFTLSLHQ